MNDAVAVPSPSTRTQLFSFSSVSCLVYEGNHFRTEDGGDIILENTLVLDNYEGMEGCDKKPKDVYKKLVGLEKKPGSAQERCNWMSVSTSGSLPQARYYHSAAVIGRKMVVVGGDSDCGMLNDVQQLHLGKLCWSRLGAVSSQYAGSRKVNCAQHLPPCRGHHLISWDQKILLVTGETDPPFDSVSVWLFDLDKENWSLLEAKGEIPVARKGYTVNRAGSVLILFGGEDMKGRKLNDLHVFDLKSTMWLPLLAMGSIPSPRSRHVATIYDDRLLVVFGGASKSEVLNDLYTLDFDTMEWSQLKTKGTSPGPRADCASVLYGEKWYIVGGESGGTRCLDTFMLDIGIMTWHFVSYLNTSSPLASQGCSLVIAERKERAFLVAYGGKGAKSAFEVGVLHISMNGESTQSSTHHLDNGAIESKNRVIIDDSTTMLLRETWCANIAAEAWNPQRDEEVCPHVVDELCSDGQARDIGARNGKAHWSKEVETMSDVDTDHSSYELQKASLQKPKRDTHFRNQRQSGVLRGKSLAVAHHEIECDSDLTTSRRKNAVTDGMGRKLESIKKSRQKAERRLAAALKENDVLRVKLAAAKLAEEESINLTNILHAENLKLDHDLTFLRAILEDTQKELKSTREVLSAERNRSFQLQVELFELKQTIQNYENGKS